MILAIMIPIMTDMFVNNTITVASGVTLTINPGATLTFAPNTGITVNGTLNAYEATFTSSSTWSGIYFASGSGGTIQTCTIQNVQAYGGGAINIFYASPTIEYCIIQNNTGVCDGVTVSNGSPFLFENTIRNNSRDGVYLYYSGALLLQNNITATSSTGNAAVYCDYYSQPLFAYTSQQYFAGINTLTGGYYGLYAGNNSTPDAGTASIAYNNRLLGNTYANAYAEQNSTVYAEYDWWGQATPDDTKIIANTGSTIYYTPYLSQDPGAAITPSFASPLNHKSKSFQLVSSISNTQDSTGLLLNAMESREKKDYQSAINIYKSILESNSPSGDANIALAELGNVYKETKDNSLLNYINTFSQHDGKFQAEALEILSNLNLTNRDLQTALAEDDQLVSNFSGTIHEKDGLLNEFYVYLYSQKFDSAKTVLSDIPALYANNKDVLLANWLLDRAAGSSSNQIIKQGTSQLASMQDNNTAPSKFQVMQNYPNPFNPSTIIHYEIPNDGLVTLRIYDELGREVKTLVNQYESKGRYDINFNASNLASGIYFYRLNAGNYSAIKKMILLK